MDRQKDLFDLFRDNQHKLDEAPSPQTWRRLERRLDARKRHHGRTRLTSMRTFSMVAALLLLAVIVFLFSLVMEHRRPAYLAANDKGPIPMEDLTYTDVDLSAYQVVEFTRKYQDRMAIPIEEGSPDKRLVPATQTRPSLERTSNAPAMPEAGKALLTHFYWLLGGWEADRAGNQSLELWRLENENTLHGIGLLLHGDDTLFQENLRLQQIDNHLYFIMALDKSRQPVKYELEEWRNGRAVFVNNGITFPQEVVLEHDPQGAYSLILQNRRPAQMSRSQIDFIRHRWDLVNQQAVRQLRKIR